METRELKIIASSIERMAADLIRSGESLTETVREIRMAVLGQHLLYNSAGVCYVADAELSEYTDEALRALIVWGCVKGDPVLDCAFGVLAETYDGDPVAWIAENLNLSGATADLWTTVVEAL